MSADPGDDDRQPTGADIARMKPDYLQWMLRDDYFDDTKAIASEALKRAG